ncbi:hypothetical protein AB0C87_06110 [Actinomadura sp. NPDC048021]|uniref:hypothetical protein n=1 Tax=Actinomadura sp. NPDC048021 TaxID=3155385 RepID=UPI0033E53F2E
MESLERSLLSGSAIASLHGHLPLGGMSRVYYGIADNCGQVVVKGFHTTSTAMLETPTCIAPEQVSTPEQITAVAPASLG